MSGETKFFNAFKNLILEHGYWRLAMGNENTFTMTRPDIENHCDEELAMLSFTTLLRYESDPDRRAYWLSCLKWLYDDVKIQRNPLHAGITSVFLPEIVDIEAGVKSLREMPTWDRRRVERRKTKQNLVTKNQLVELLGTTHSQLTLSGSPPFPVLLVGLQGSGKTTTIAKLAYMLKKGDKHRPYLVPADVYRPAAIDQLVTLAKQINVPCYPSAQSDDPVDICKKAVKEGPPVAGPLAFCLPALLVSIIVIGLAYATTMSIEVLKFELLTRIMVGF
jgi:hypothetical protein